MLLTDGAVALLQTPGTQVGQMSTLSFAKKLLNFDTQRERGGLDVKIIYKVVQIILLQYIALKLQSYFRVMFS